MFTLSKSLRSENNRLTFDTVIIFGIPQFFVIFLSHSNTFCHKSKPLPRIKSVYGKSVWLMCLELDNEDSAYSYVIYKRFGIFGNPAEQ